ncbi:MAG: phage tail protein [Betaproteobacteria bacterium]|nr:phage tail protein [Betaproteobacteria bacterium]
MDANGLRFWQLADAGNFPALAHATWDDACRVLRLASERTLTPALDPAAAFTAAQGALEQCPRAVDGLECVAYWDAAANTVMAASYLPDPTPLLALEATPTDLCAGYDGVLYAAMADHVRLHDLRGRWGDVSVALAGFAPWRMAPDETGGVWVLERGSGRLARVTGLPLRSQTPQSADYDPRVFRPNPENCHAPRLDLVAAPNWAGDERVLALATLPGDGLALLTWRGGDGVAYVRRWLAAEARPAAPIGLQGANYAYALTGLGAGRFAVRVPGRRDAPAFALPAAHAPQSILPLGEVYPLADGAQEAPFANGTAQPPHYPVGSGASRPLYPLSLRFLARDGEACSYDTSATPFSAWMIDSGAATTVWHRLYAEAAIPTHAGFVVWLAAGNEARPPDADDLTQWHAHGFGRDCASLDPALRAPHIPRASWERSSSELPGHPGLLGGAPQAGTRGLFSVLIQNTQQRVRRLTGRYLWVRVVLHGDGRNGPEIAALRAWGSRFDYAEQYLPRLYRESLFGDAAAAPGVELARVEVHVSDPLVVDDPILLRLDAQDVPAVRAWLNPDANTPRIPLGDPAEIVVEHAGAAWLLRDPSSSWRLRLEIQGAPVKKAWIVVYEPQATPADFNARMLSNYEGVLTPLEDRIAAAHLLSNPDSVPEANLDWLGAWIGVAFDPVLPASRRRDWLRAASDLARLHGTRQGLRLALDIATGGGVRSGGIVVIEDFRLRRILATLLGVDLADEADPLLPGLAQSGNSVVGDTLFLGDRERTELLALYGAQAATAAENEAVLDFYGRLASRATILVHREVEAQDFALIRRIAQMEAPAHVEVRVVAASWPLLVGIASLIGVDTYLGPPRLPRPVQVERSFLGISDYLIGVAALDPRLAGAAPTSTPPVADAGPDRTVPWGESFLLDGSASHAGPGHSITEYRWRQLPPDS